MTTPTDQQINDAVNLLRQASTGTMVFRGRLITETDVRRAQRTLAAAPSLTRPAK